ncbi:hypothetical protein ACFLXU_03045 [Chloroflexota bacterium]
MPSRENVKEATLILFKEIIERAKLKLGENIKVTQRSSWMVKTGETSRGSEYFTREVVNAVAVDMMVALEMRTGCPEKEKLVEILIDAGFERINIEFNMIQQLVRGWLNVANPLEVDGEDVNKVIEEFTDMIIDKVVHIHHKYALIEMDEKSIGFKLDDGVNLRKISQEELWEFGRTDGNLSPAQLNSSITRWDTLSEHWMILEIETMHKLENTSSSKILMDAVLMDLLITANGRFKVIDLGSVNYSWFSGIFIEDQAVRSVMALEGGRLLVNEEVKKQMIDRWPQILQVFKTDSKLKLPASRLMEGLGRNDLRDSVLDFAIGLESFLTRRTDSNMSYRFALRGSYILNWDSGNKESWFGQLRDFYSIRSAIAHGEEVKRDKLIDCCKIGVNALKEIWWWFAINVKDDINKGIEMVEAKILE